MTHVVFYPHLKDCKLVVCNNTHGKMLEFKVLSLYLCRSGNGWWWVPLVAPPIGGVLGGGLYKALVEMHHPSLSEQDDRLMEEEAAPLGKQENICANLCV